MLAACAPTPPAPPPRLDAGAGEPGTVVPARPAAPARLRWIGTARLPHAMEFLGSTVGGISGIDYDPVQDRWVLLSDDRSARQPARFYTASLHYRADALETPRLTGAFTLRQPGGAPFPSALEARRGGPAAGEIVDPEAVRWLPGGRTLLWTSEGDFARGSARRCARAVPTGRPCGNSRCRRASSRSPGTGADRAPTARSKAWPCLPDGRTAWLAMEGAWRQDGPLPTRQAPGGPLRITALDLATGRALRQIAYVPDAVPRERRIPWGPRLNGVSEILADGPGHLLVLERAYSAGAGFSARLYRIDTRSATDTLALERLEPGNHVPAAKTLVADMPGPGLDAVDNLEGMAWGPPLPGGGRVIVFVSDDNFNPAQATQFIAAEYLQPDASP